MGCICSKQLTADASASIKCEVVDTYLQRCEVTASSLSGVATLLDTCIASLIRSSTKISPALVNRLTDDLAQRLLEGLINARTLDYDSLLVFKNSNIWRLCIPAYPGAHSSWLNAIPAAPLRLVDLRRIDEVDDSSVAALTPAKHLRTLNIASSNISSGAFRHISAFQELTHLDVTDCELLGSAGLAHLLQLSRLQTASFKGCRRISAVGVLQALSNCADLRHLDMSWCQGDAIDWFAQPCLFAPFKRLTHLNLGMSSLPPRALPGLASLVKLERLNMNGVSFIAADSNVFDGPGMCQEAAKACLANITALTQLELKWSQLSPKEWCSLAALHNLRHLNCAHSDVSDESIRHLTSLSNLTYLNLDSADVSDLGVNSITSLKGLKHLNLADTKVENFGTKYLSSLQSLEHLNLSYSNITDEGVSQLGALTALTYLSIDSRLISDTGLSSLHPLTRLAKLDIFGCKLTHASAPDIAKLTSVKWLEAAGGVLCNRGVHALSAMTQLTYLSVAQNPGITDACIHSLAKLKNLESLNISGTSITTAKLQGLSVLTSLSTLSMYGLQSKKQHIDRFRANKPNLNIVGGLCARS